MIDGLKNWEPAPVYEWSRLFSKGPLTWNVTLMKEYIQLHKLKPSQLDIRDLEAKEEDINTKSTSGPYGIVVELYPGVIMFVDGLEKALQRKQLGHDTASVYFIPYELQMYFLTDRQMIDFVLENSDQKTELL